MRQRERRRRPRIDVALPLLIRYNEKEISAASKNISVLGAYVEIKEEFPVGADLIIQIKLPKKEANAVSGQQISCSGAVFRCQRVLSEEPENKYGVGVFFRSFSRAGEKTLTDYIERRVLLEQKAGKIYIRKRSKNIAKEEKRNEGKSK